MCCPSQGLPGPPGPEGAEGKPGTQVPILYHISIHHLNASVCRLILAIASYPLYQRSMNSYYFSHQGTVLTCGRNTDAIVELIYSRNIFKKKYLPILQVHIYLLVTYS